MTGEKLPCPRCSHLTDPESIYYDSCGEAIVPTGEDRHFLARQVLGLIGYVAGFLAIVFGLGAVWKSYIK